MIGLAVVIVQRVGDRVKGNCAVSIVDGACNIVRCAVRHGGSGIVWQRGSITIGCLEFEAELTVGQIHRAVFILVDFLGLNIERLCVIFKVVDKRSTIRGGTIFRNGAICHFQLAAAIVRDGNSHTVEGTVIRNAGDFIGGDILGDVVHIRAGFLEGDTSEVKGNLRSVGGAIISHQLERCIEFAIT